MATQEHNNLIDVAMFRAYDIRGIVGEGLTTASVMEIGRAIGSFARAKGECTIITGRDGRLSGPVLLQALQQGLLQSGVNVVDIGEVPTPVLYFATHELRVPSGVMLTGSHNPPNYNGIKLVIAGETIFGDDIQALYQRIVTRAFETGEGTLCSVSDISERYIARIVSDIRVKKPLHVVLDCGNGVTGHIAPHLFRRLGCRVTELYCEVNGHFPHHHPDPSKLENLQAVKEKVLALKADIGLAFDGDGDRLGVITNQGEVIWPDRQLILYARDVLSRVPGATILFDVKCTAHLPDAITQAGGKALMWKTGHSFMKAKIKETGAMLAGEMSGHLFFKERWYGFDDGLYAAARLLEIISNTTESVADIFSRIPNSINTPEMNVWLADERKHAFVEALAKHSLFKTATHLSTIDGVRADFPEGWGLVRASNTTPCLVIRFESQTQVGLLHLQQQFRAALLSLDATLDIPF